MVAEEGRRGLCVKIICCHRQAVGIIATSVAGRRHLSSATAVAAQGQQVGGRVEQLFFRFRHHCYGALVLVIRKSFKLRLLSLL